MALQQYQHAFLEPLAAEHPGPLIRLLGLRNSTARSLSLSVGPISHNALANPPPGPLQSPWDAIALRHCACAHALYNNNYQDASVGLCHLHVSGRFTRGGGHLLKGDVTVHASKPGLIPVLPLAGGPVFLVPARAVHAADRASGTSRAGGLYYIRQYRQNASFGGMHQDRQQSLYDMYYRQVGKPNLCKNIVRAVVSDPNTPSDEKVPLVDRVTWHFYLGLMAFLAGDDNKAEKELDWALMHCPASAHRNVELILTYLIPLRLLKARFPSRALLSLFPRLQEVYGPFIAAIKSGNVREYDERLEWAQPRLVGMSVYLTVERAREGCLQLLFRKAWIASEKSSRMPISTFQAALEIHGVKADADEVECMVANMIFRDLIKGYISHGMQMVVVGKTNPFPSLASINR